jgi:hypothetical protein
MSCSCVNVFANLLGLYLLLAVSLSRLIISPSLTVKSRYKDFGVKDISVLRIYLLVP